MESSERQISTRKRTFWRMLRTVFSPARTVAKLMIGCGSSKRKGKRRLKLSSMKDAREAFLRGEVGPPIPRTIGAEPQHQPRVGNNENHNIPQLSSEYRNVERQDIIVSNSTIPFPDTPPNSDFSINESNDNDDSDSCILTLATTPPTSSVIIPARDAQNHDRLPAPLSLDEAQIYLDSLTLQDENSYNYEERIHPNQINNTPAVEQLVTVEIENTGRLFQDEETVSEQIEVPHRNEEEIEVYNSSNDSERRIQRNHTRSSMPRIDLINVNGPNHSETNLQDDSVQMRRSRTSASLSAARSGDDEFHGWRRSSIEVTSNPPVTLAFIPSGLCLGDRIVWVRDDQPEIGTVRWIGKIRNQFYAGIEFDKPVGNSSGIYGYGVGLHKRLFTCQLPYGRFVPVKELVLYKDYHDTGVKSGIVCVICRDDFLDTWEPDSFLQNSVLDCDDDDETLQPFHMVSTKCGHLYHWGCLDQWFSTKKRSEFHCPFCLRSMGRTEVIRIFPSQI